MRDLVTAMTTPGRYLELCELAECSPDSPHIAWPGDHDGQARWLAVRLAKRGHRITVTECAEAANAFWSQWSARRSYEGEREHVRNAGRLAVQLADLLRQTGCTADDAEELSPVGWALAYKLVRRTHRPGFFHVPGEVTRAATVAALRESETHR